MRPYVAPHAIGNHPRVAPTICYLFAHDFIPKRIGFLHDIAQEKWPLRGIPDAFVEAGRIVPLRPR